MTKKNNESANPYVASLANSDANAEPDAKRSVIEEIRKIFVSWELLRIPYNIILIALTLVLAIQGSAEIFVSPGFWMFAIQGALVVNICFMAGPVAESYLRWLGIQVSGLRASLFILGTLFSVILVIVTMSTNNLPVQN